MSKPIYIKCMDEGHTAIATSLPSASCANTALMVNPSAAVDVLLDAALTRSMRIEAVTRLFNFLTTEDAALPGDVSQDLLSSLNGMSQEVVQLIDAAQAALPSVEKEANHE